MMPPAIAAPRARWALAGVAVSAAATVATARSAANVFFMSWTLLEMRRLSAPRGSARGLRLIRNAEFGIYHAVKEAHNGQPKVNAAKILARKTVFSGQYSEGFFKISRMR
jgi:hypothetical protein